MPDDAPLDVVRRPRRASSPPADLAAAGPDLGHLRAKLAGLLDASRQDALRYAVLAVLLTPVLLVLAGLLVALGLAMAKGHPLGLSWARLLPGVTGGLGFLVLASLFQRARTAHRGQGGWSWQLAGLALYAVLVAFVATTSLVGAPFAAIWLALALGVLLLLGRDYEARETTRGWRDDAWLAPGDWLVGDLERAHLSLGVAIAGTELLLGAWGAIATGGWTWRAYTEAEVATAADVVRHAAAGDDAAARRALGRVPGATRARVMRALTELDLVRSGPALAPTLAGKAMIGEVSRG